MSFSLTKNDPGPLFLPFRSVSQEFYKPWSSGPVIKECLSDKQYDPGPLVLSLRSVSQEFYKPWSSGPALKESVTRNLQALVL